MGKYLSNCITVLSSNRRKNYLYKIIKFNKEVVNFIFEILFKLLKNYFKQLEKQNHYL